MPAPASPASTVDGELAGAPGASTAVGRFSLSPHFGEPGTAVTLRLVFDRSVAGVDEMTVTFDGEPWGSPIVLEGNDTSVERAVPTVAAGEYPVTLTTGGAPFATAMFEVLEVRPAWTIPPWLWWAAPLGAVIMWIVWMAFERKRPRTAPTDVYQSALARRIRQAAEPED